MNQILGGGYCTNMNQIWGVGIYCTNMKNWGETGLYCTNMKNMKKEKEKSTKDMNQIWEETGFTLMNM